MHSFCLILPKYPKRIISNIIKISVKSLTFQCKTVEQSSKFVALHSENKTLLITLFEQYTRKIQLNKMAIFHLLIRFTSQS